MDATCGYNSNYPNGIYVADMDGNVIKAAASEATYSDVKNATWYKEGLSRINMHYGTAYQSAEGINQVSASAIINDGSDQTRVISADVSLERITIIVNSFVKMNQAKAFLVDSRDHTILALIGRGFTYCVPPFMIRSDVVTGVMSFAEMDAMMYKIEGEDLYLIGTSEHSMIGKFIDQILPEEKLPYTLTSYSPCFRKEKGAHGIEERGVYRIHQFEKQEMSVVCRPEESPMWFDKLWQNTVDLFRSLDIPVRTLECCSGDLADLKVKSVDVEAWSPRQKKYFEVGSCSNLGAPAHRR